MVMDNILFRFPLTITILTDIIKQILYIAYYIDYIIV